MWYGETCMKTLKKTSNPPNLQTPKGVLPAAGKIRRLLKFNAASFYPVNHDFSQIPHQENAQNDALAHSLDLERRQATGRIYANTLTLR
jgi:hypothetical protein